VDRGTRLSGTGCPGTTMLKGRDVGDMCLVYVSPIFSFW